MRKHLPPKDCFLGKTLPRFSGHVIQEHVASGSNGHLFRAFDSSTNSVLAFKVVPIENLPADSDDQQAYLDEAKKANILEHESVIKCIEVFPFYEPEKKKQCVIFVYNYVEGINLRDYAQKNSSEIDVPFVENFLQTIFGLLYELEQRGIQHGDLHAGNVLVAKSRFDINGQTRFRVTDFGVQQLSGQPAHASDYLSVAQTLELLLNCIEYRDCEGRDRFVYDVLRNDFLKRHLIETDTSADLLAGNPRKMSEKLASIDNQYQNTGKEPLKLKLVTPFDYPNCEQMGNSHLLLKNLYSNRLLGLSEIHSHSNLVLTGPRGCGKTTVFRALSLEYLISTGHDHPDNIDYIGIYYRCDDLYFAFPRYKQSERPEALDIPIHFLIVTLLAFTLEQVRAWARKYFKSEFETKETAFVADLWDLLGLGRPDNPSVTQLETLINRLKGKERKRAKEKQRFAHVSTEPIENYFGPGLIFEACRLIRNRFSFLEERPFLFFIDDYSDPKITQDLQANLNRILMHRNPDVFFKLSTESPVSFVRMDVDGKKYVETREFDLLNLGLRYLTNELDQAREFLEDLFNRRFRKVEGYPVQTLEELLGSMPRKENATARVFREPEKHSHERKFGHYAGCETIAAMCSGDIHYIIRLVSRMVEDYGGRDNLMDTTTTPRIPAQRQNASIRAVAGEFMESIRTLPGEGSHLADVVTAFGNVARSYLLHETSTNESGNPPHQASRIEPYGPLHLSDQAQKILNELLRYSVLIEDPRGKSRRGKVVPRFHLRRYLIPHFNLTFSRRDSIQLENDQLESFLCEPNKFEDKMRLMSKEDAARRRRMDPNQMNWLEDG